MLKTTNVSLVSVVHDFFAEASGPASRLEAVSQASLGGFRPVWQAAMSFVSFVQSRCEWLTFLPSVVTPAEFQIALDKASSVMIAQASINKKITPEMASNCIGVVSKCMGEEAAAELTASMRHLVYVANHPPPLQTAPFCHRYMTASLRSFYKSSAQLD